MSRDNRDASNSGKYPFEAGPQEAPQLSDIFISVSGGRRSLHDETKEQPWMTLVIKHVTFSAGSRVLLWPAGSGALGLLLALSNPDSNFEMWAADWRQLEICDKTLALNAGISNLSLRETPAITGGSGQFDDIVYVVPAFVPMQSIHQQISGVCRQLKVSGDLVLLGHNQQGIKRLIKKTAEILGVDSPTSVKAAGGCRIAVFRRPAGQVAPVPDQTPEKVHFEVLGRSFVMETSPGLFSAKGLDIGTRFLLETVAPIDFKFLLDFGCGWGAIGLTAASLSPGGRVMMVDVEPDAIETAARNTRILGLEDRVAVKPTTFLTREDGPFDRVLSNPPFHASAEALEQLFRLIKLTSRAEAQISLVVERSFVNKFRFVLDHVFARPVTEVPGKNYSVLTVRCS